ncbi:hypothetical protein PAEPH01_2480 [Pancytospora epiphaga]|nr:hypothetical protein PAEPH01_2480 [Pancytospora epiphaga]
MVMKIPNRIVNYNMESKQKKFDSEQTKDTPMETGKVVAGDTGDGVEKRSTDVPGPAASRMIALEALIHGVKALQCRWPGEVLRAVIDRSKASLSNIDVDLFNMETLR